MVIPEEKYNFLYRRHPYIINPREVHKGEKVVVSKNITGHRPYINYHQTTPRKTAFQPYQPIPAELIFTDEEEKKIAGYKKQLGDFVFIEPHVKKSLHADNKDWGFKKYKQVAEKVNCCVQPVYNGKTLPCKHVKTNSFWDAVLLLKASKTALLPEGGLMHAAAALNKPSVIIFGGLISPSITGYDLHTNLYSGEGCGSRKPCAHCKKTMGNITVNQVVKEIERLLKQ